MPSRFVRTPAGQVEIQARALKLSRPARNLLLVINDSRSLDDWLVQVHGVTPEDVALLRDNGLIAEAGGAAGAAPRPAGAGPAPADLREPASRAPAPAAAPATPDSADWDRTQQVIRAAAYTPLYDALNSVGKAKLGLMRGYRFALEIEKCNGIEDLRSLALRFAEQLRQEHGMAAVGELTYAIGAVKA
ncbi:hypothetical protein [Ideonella sp.]|uniref:hypothetical protein n=1 Tax=Ideonella sp. TaxID=1929293 RepID=UPI0035B44172